MWLKEAAVSATVLCALAAGARGQCEATPTNYQGETLMPGVMRGNGTPGIVRSFVQHDPDGFNTGGPNLMVMAGDFASAGTLTGCNGLVAFDGFDFVHLGSPAAPNRPVSPHVLTVVPSGPAQGLYAGWSGGISRFFNGSWSLVSTASPTALIAWDPDQAGPLQFNLVYTVQQATVQVLRWDGFNQIPEATFTRAGGTAFLDSLTIYDPDGAGFSGDWLVFSGFFDTVNGTGNFGNVGALTTFASQGGTLSTLSGGMNGRVVGVTQWKRGTPNNALALIGNFTAARTNGSGSRGAIYDGFNYAPFNATFPFEFNSSRITTWDPDGPGGSAERVIINCPGTISLRQGVYAYNAGSTVFEFVAGGDGLAAQAIGVWDQVGNRSQPEWIFAGGEFAQGGWETSGSTLAPTTRYNSVARTRQLPSSTSTFTWIPLPNNGMTSPIFAMGAANVERSLGGADRLYIYGGFQELDGSLIANLARSNGVNSWLSTGAASGVFNSFARFRASTSPFTNDVLYAGGSVFARMSAPVGGPNSWTTLSTPTGGSIAAMVQFDPDGAGPIPTSVIVAGGFTNIGGIGANRIAYFTPSTSTWGTLGSGFNGAVNALALFDFDGNGPGSTRLVAGGNFTTAGGVAAARLAFWDGLQWFPMPDGGPNGPVHAILAQNQLTNNPAISRIIVGGEFTSIGGRPCSNVAAWQTGSIWTDLFQGVNGRVTAIAQIDLNGTQNADVDQNGPEVIIGGSFTGSPQPNRPAVRGLARLGPGAQWNPIGSLYGFGGGLPTITGITQVFSNSPSGRPRVLVGGLFAATTPDNAAQNLVALEETTPYIQTGPSSVSSACVGDEVTFTVSVSGPNLVYRWQRNSVNLFPGPTGSGSSLAGVDGPTLTISGVTSADHGTYTCVITNACGQATTLPGVLSGVAPCCGTSDFNCDGDFGTDQDIEAFFACLGGTCPPAPCTETSDFNRDGDFGTDADIEAFFRVLAGGNC